LIGGVSGFCSFLASCRDACYGLWGFRGFGKQYRLRALATLMLSIEALLDTALG
jgi:hypothetical protein